MNTKPTSIVIHCLVAGALLGGILDTGMGSILPSAPWPAPLGTGFGTVIGSAVGVNGFIEVLLISFVLAVINLGIRMLEIHKVLKNRE